MATTLAAKEKYHAIEPYLYIFEQAMLKDGVTARQVAEQMGVSVQAVKARIYRLVWTGALVAIGKRPIIYKPGHCGGCRKVAELGLEHSVAWVDQQAQTNPPGQGLL